MQYCDIYFMLKLTYISLNNQVHDKLIIFSFLFESSKELFWCHDYNYIAQNKSAIVLQGPVFVLLLFLDNSLNWTKSLWSVIVTLF